MSTKDLVKGLPPSGPLDLLNSVKRLDVLLQMQIEQSERIGGVLSALERTLIIQAPAFVAGAPRPQSQLAGITLNLPGVQTTRRISPALAHDPVLIAIAAYKTVTPVDPTNPNRTQLFLTNVGSNPIYYGFTPNVQPSGLQNQGNVMLPPSGTDKRGDVYNITDYTGPVYATCDSGSTSSLVKMDVVTQL